MIYIYTPEEVIGRKVGTAAITNEDATLEADLTELRDLVAGVYYMSVRDIQSPYSSKSLVRMMGYIRDNFRSKIEFVGAGNTFTHLIITLV